MTGRTGVAMATMALLFAGTTARAETQLMGSDTYAQAAAAGYWTIQGQTIPQPGDPGHWVWCVDISQALGWAGDPSPGAYRLMVVNTGIGQWAWNDFSGANPCVGLQRTVAINPYSLVPGGLTLTNPNPPDGLTPPTSTASPSNPPPPPPGGEDPWEDLRNTGQ